MEESIDMLMSVQQTAANFLVEYSFQIFGALIILLVGAWVASRIGKLTENQMVRRDIDVTLSRFTGSSVRLLLLFLFLMIALSNLGVSITPLVAAIGALSIGAGLAVQGMLSNYAAGFTIILTRPFVVGDTIRVQNVGGLVDEVHLGYTILKDEDDVRIQIPNRLIIGEILHNSGGESLVHVNVGISYGSDTDQAIRVINQAIAESGIDSARKAIVGIEEFADSSIVIGVRFWAPTERKYQVQYQTNGAILRALSQAGIAIPFPQREVRVLNDANSGLSG